jgi:predicted dehydrogenase
MSVLRIGVIGAGAFGRRHVEVLLGEPSCVIAGIADPTSDAAAFAAARGLPYFADHRQLLAARPDGVIVATPNSLHAPVGLDCVAHGVPVLVEKPIAETVAAARALAEAASKAGVPLLVGHHRRHNPIIEAARDIVRGGGIGRLTAISALWLLQKPADYFATQWRREKGGGPVLINLIHDIDDLRFICGEITMVQAMTANGARGFAVEDTAAVLLCLAGGALATITVSDAVAAPWSWELTSGENPIYPPQRENCYLFAGTEGGLAVPSLKRWFYGENKGWTAPLLRERIAVEPADPMMRQLRHFCRVIRGEEAPRITGADATRTLEVAQSILEAAASGRPVELREVA